MWEMCCENFWTVCFLKLDYNFSLMALCVQALPHRLTDEVDKAGEIDLKCLCLAFVRVYSLVWFYGYLMK